MHKDLSYRLTTRTPIGKPAPPASHAGAPSWTSVDVNTSVNVKGTHPLEECVHVMTELLQLLTQALRLGLFLTEAHQQVVHLRLTRLLRLRPPHLARLRHRLKPHHRPDGHAEKLSWHQRCKNALKTGDRKCTCRWSDFVCSDGALKRCMCSCRYSPRKEP
eukprot:693532-Prorocentrum_minimum.AAC.4